MSEEGDPDVVVRQARADDHEAISEFTADTWPDRDVTDYVPRVFPEWVETDGPDQRTFVAEIDGDPVGLCQGVGLSAHEAWAQGMRVDPGHRGGGIAHRLNDAVFAWAADAGLSICRSMVFSWNVAGLGTTRSVGYEPATEFRWVHPEPDANATGNDRGLRVVERSDAAWTYWQRSDAREALGGLALALDESWAVAELSRDSLGRVADEERLLTVQDESGTRGFAARVRTDDREGTDERWAEYGVAAWADVPAARTLFAAIARDAAGLDADRTRVLVPETPRHVSDAGHAGHEIASGPDFVLEADLTGR